MPSDQQQKQKPTTTTSTITSTANTGLIFLKIPEKPDDYISIDKFNHFLKDLDGPQAVILGKIEEGSPQEVSFMEDCDFPKPNGGGWMFKAVDINSKTFRVLVQKNFEGPFELGLRWWAIRSEIKEEQGGEMRRNESISDTLAKNVKWNISVHVERGPSLISSEQIMTDAVDTVTATLKPGDVNIPVLVQPSSLDKIQFICIKSDNYENLSYKFNDGTSDTDAIPLDKAHFLTSPSLIGLFKKAPKTIKFSNSGANDAKIDIVVARQASV